MDIFKFINGNTNLLIKNLYNKKVLVLGSGPSAREVDWQNKDWDILVSTSFFYLNPNIISNNPLHITLSDLVDLDNSILNQYLNKNPKCTIAFEPKPHPFYNTTQYKNFIEKYKDRIIYYNTIGGKEGVAARLCWLILSCSPKNIQLCGIDGISKSPQLDPPNYFRNHHGTTDKYSYNEYYKDFQLFGKRLYTLGKKNNIPIINLGKGKPYNMITNISKEHEGY